MLLFISNYNTYYLEPGNIYMSLSILELRVLPYTSIFFYLKYCGTL